MLSGKNITENTIAIFFAFLPMMLLMGLLWFFVISDADKARDYLGKYQVIARRQDREMNELQNWVTTIAYNVEILRIQVNQLKPLKRK